MNDRNATIPNMDFACAERGRKLAALGKSPQEIESTLTKALAVLEEQGVYAMFLYLFAREKRCGVDELCQLLNAACGVDLPTQCAAELKNLESQLENARQQEVAQGRQQQPLQRGRRGRQQTAAGTSQITRLEKEIQTTKIEFFKKLESLADNPDQLLFAREVLQKALVYGRYHAKACQGTGDRE